jgi:tetratricopeptide (TPR) repeat protein
MSRTLNLVEHLAARGRKYQERGLLPQASRTWSKLAGLRDLPGAIAEEAQKSLAEIHLDCRRYARARRTLTAALTHQPDNAHYHFLLASAIEVDERCDPEKALTHYRQAVQLDAGRPKYLCSLGLLALDLGYIEEGLDCLRRALALAPDDFDVISKVVEGFQEENPEEAKEILRLARFRHARDARFTKLWSDFHFHCLRVEQARKQKNIPEQEGPTLLPFVRVEGGNKVRRDSPSRPARPHIFIPRPDKKHA